MALMTTIKEVNEQVTNLQLNVARLMSELEVSRHENQALLEELRQANDTLYKLSSVLIVPSDEDMPFTDRLINRFRENVVPIVIEAFMLALFLFAMTRFKF